MYDSQKKSIEVLRWEQVFAIYEPYKQSVSDTDTCFLVLSHISKTFLNSSPNKHTSMQKYHEPLDAEASMYIFYRTEVLCCRIYQSSDVRS